MLGIRIGREIPYEAMSNAHLLNQDLNPLNMVMIENENINVLFGLYTLMIPSSSPVKMDSSPSAKKKSVLVMQTWSMSFASNTSLYGSS